MANEILIVDDEPDIRLLIDGILRDEGYETRQAAESEAALAAFRVRRPSLVILDVWLQGSRMDGLGILRVLRSEEPQVPVVMISGHGNIEMAVAAIQQGAYDFIEKPFSVDGLLQVVDRALESQSAPDGPTPLTDGGPASSERLVARVSADQKRLFQRAAALDARRQQNRCLFGRGRWRQMMSGTQSLTSQPSRCRNNLQRKRSLLICCKAGNGSRAAELADPD